jgi:alanyl-tRNA synthetase
VDKPFGHDDARYVEIWNLVFMQFDRMEFFEEEFSKEFELNKPFGKLIPKGFKLIPLPKPSIDTGMGLERVAAVLQGKISNFETDLFTPLIEQAALLLHVANDVGNASLRIIADHARAATFLVNDGVVPSNEGRGYVLRKILRRAFRHARLLEVNEPVVYMMATHVITMFGVPSEKFAYAPYPELLGSANRIEKVLYEEEKQFDRVLKSGLEEFDEQITRLFLPYNSELESINAEPAMRLAEAKLKLGETLATGIQRAIWIDGLKRRGIALTLPGDKAFYLYETFGLPLDFMVDAARDAGVKFDDEGFEKARAEEQARARASWKGGAQKTASPAFRDLPKTVFEGYRQLTSTNCEVLAIVKGGVGVPAAKAGDEVEVVLDHTSFYGDSGGQVGDLGVFLTVDGNSTVAEIVGCVLPVQGVRAHKAILKQDLAVGDLVTTQVNGERRDAIRRNHTGTHLLHAALRQVLGTHVKQAGSAVHPDRLRFDFSHFAQVADEELQEIEDIVNREVLKNAKVETLEDVPIDVAVSEYHAMALFGEKYGDKVRVVRLADGFSTELCGGTHTAATGEVGLFKLTGEESVSSGVRRIEAITGMGSLDTFRRDFELAQVAGQYVPSVENLTEGLKAKFASQEDELKKLRREIEEMRMKSAAGGLDEAVARAVDVKGVKVLTHRADGLERGQLRTLVDNLKGKLGEGVVVLGSAQPEGKVAIIAGVTPGLTKRIQAGKLVGAVAKLVGGSGGGKPEIAEAGGKDQAQIDAALKAAAGIVGELLG